MAVITLVESQGLRTIYSGPAIGLNRRVTSAQTQDFAPVPSDRGFSLSARHDLAHSLHESLLASDPFNPTGRMSVQPR